MAITLHTASGSFRLADKYATGDLVQRFGETRESRPVIFELHTGGTLMLYWREGGDWAIEFDADESEAVAAPAQDSAA